MSLKLGNTNIAGTQVLYSTTGNNTDGAMTQNATTTSLNLKANDADVVHKTGDETITGHKVFTNNIDRNVDAIRGQTPSRISFSDIRFIDNNNNWLAGLEYTLATDKSSRISLIISDSVEDTTNVKGSIELGVEGNGYVYTTAPASDINNSIVTTVSKSKSANGYFKLGNGLIIQWLYFAVSNNYVTVTFPTSFSNTNYAIVQTPISNNSNYPGGAWAGIRDKTTTNVKLGIRAGAGIAADTSYSHAIAIGY